MATIGTGLLHIPQADEFGDDGGCGPGGDTHEASDIFVRDKAIFPGGGEGINLHQNDFLVPGEVGVLPYLGGNPDSLELSIHRCLEKNCPPLSARSRTPCVLVTGIMFHRMVRASFLPLNIDLPKIGKLFL